MKTNGWREAHPLTGLMYCADCGGKMYIQRINNGKRVPMYHCSNYPKVPVATLCHSAHRIKADHVMEIVSKTIKEVIPYASLDKEHFVEEIQSHIQDRQTVDRMMVVTFHGMGQVIKQQFRQSVALGPPERRMRKSAP